MTGGPGGSAEGTAEASAADAGTLRPADPAALPPDATRPGADAARPTGLDVVPPELLILCGALSVQGGAGLATQLLREYGPLPIVAMRIGFGALLLLLVRPVDVRSATRRALVVGVMFGAILAAMNSIFYVSLSRIPLGVAVTIEFWGPLAVAILGSRRLLDLVWVVLAATGIYLLAGQRIIVDGHLVTDDLLGIAAAATAGFCWALYILVGRHVAAEWPNGRGLTLAMLVATLLVLPVTLVFGDVRPVLSNPAVLAGGVVVALFSSAIPYTTEIAALRRLKPSTFGVLMSLEPAIAAMVGFVILGQVLGREDIVAIALVAIASAGASLSARRLTVAAGELEAA